MTNAELIALAKEVGFCVADAAYPYTVKPVASAEQLERFANLVAAKEREECAKVCDPYTHGQWFASKIRARKL